MEPTVFLTSAALVIAFVLVGSFYTAAVQYRFSLIQEFIVERLGWVYVVTTAVMVVFTIVTMTSRYGNLRLGGNEARPEFPRLAWFAMLFSAGMGTGLVFWGVAEPMTHYLNPPLAAISEEDVLRQSMRLTYFHWGLQPWAVYAVFGLGIAFFHFNRGLPLAPRSILQPLVGERYRGFIGHAVDILCTVGTLFGVATSLGLGAMQLNAGLSYFADLQVTEATQVTLIAIVTVIATISVVTGVKVGIRFLSELNLALAAALMLFVALCGPTLYLLEVWISSLGNYLGDLIPMTLWISHQEARSWQQEWTFFYWGWWISWSPFVGIFTARISYGRTVREYLATMLLGPTVVTFAWLCVFGATAIEAHQQGSTVIAEAMDDNVAHALYALLETLPLSSLSLGFASLLVLIFFVTSSDSGSLVNDMVTSGGDPNPPRAQRVFWAVSEGAVAGTLLITGGLEALQTASLTSGIPMALLLLALAWGVHRGLREEFRERPPTRPWRALKKGLKAVTRPTSEDA